MANQRTVEFSLDHLVAEIASFPISAIAAYELGLDRLDVHLRSTSARTLWRAAEREFIARFPHTAIDELVSLRNLLWAPPTSGTVIPLHEYVRHVAGLYLRDEGAHAVPSLPPEAGTAAHVSFRAAPEPAARRAWRWLAFALPTDLLLAGLSRGDSGPATVQIVSPTVQTLLDSGYAETHLHYGVAFDFGMGWAASVNVLGRPRGTAQGLDAAVFQSPGSDHSEGRDLGLILMRAVAVRYLLGRFLAERRTRTDLLGLKFEGWFRKELSAPETVSEFLDFRVWGETIQHLAGVRLQVTSDPYAEFIRVQSLYNRWAGVSTRRFPSRLAEVQRLDPLSDFFRVNPPPLPTVQFQFLRAGFSYLDTCAEDHLFSQLFWQVERVRCFLYRHCIQRPLTPGLTNFIRFYERKGVIANPLEDVLIESAALLGGINQGLTSLEIRTSPRRRLDEQRKELQQIRQVFQLLDDRLAPGAPGIWGTGARSEFDASLTRSQNGRRMEFGLVLHFLRRRGRFHDSGHPQVGDVGDFADPNSRGPNPNGYRWDGFYRDRLREAVALGNALAAEPELLHVLRGLDVCRDEPGVPIWLIAPLFNTVRDRVRAIRANYLERHRHELPTLRSTAHVGEDFVHLGTGLRAMDDAIRYLKLGGGDRVGHGLALGVDPLEWSRRTTRLAMPREDRWFDLIWEWQWHSEIGSRFHLARRGFVAQEIVRLANTLFHCVRGFRQDFSDWTIDQAIEFQRGLHDMPRLARLGFPNGWLAPSLPSNKIDAALELYLWHPGVFSSCRTVEWVESAHEGETLHELQRLVRQRYADLGITIEVNPISNLLVGDLTDLTSHPLWRLAPKWGDQFGPSLRMCVGSDDPFPFATNLREEYQFLYDSLILAGKSPPEARDWLDLVRQMGWESRFTR